MKFKQRALSFLLSLMMVLTFMPAMAFADDDMDDSAGSEGWFSVYVDESDVELIDDEYCTLRVDTEFEGYDGDPGFRYQWFDENDNQLDSDTKECTVYEAGDYYCVVSDNLGNDPQYAYFHVSHPYIGEYPDYWWISALDDNEVNLNSNGEATLAVRARAEDGYEVPELSYQWFDENGNKIGENSTSITVNKVGKYRCEATDGNISNYTTFRVYNSKYWWTDYNGSTKHLFPGETTNLEVNVEVETDSYTRRGLEIPTFTYEWFVEEWDEDKEEDVRKKIGSNTNMLEGVSDGTYICVITDSYGNSDDAKFYVEEYDSEGGWIAYPKDNERDLYLSLEGTATLSVVVESLEGTLPKLSYSWDGDNPPAGQSGPEITVSEEGWYECCITDGNIEKYVSFYVNEHEDDDIEWSVYSESYECYLVDGKAKLVAEPEYWGEGTPQYTYQWKKVTTDEYGDEVSSEVIPGATGASYTAKEKGEYYCEVTITVNGMRSTRSTDFEVYDWWIINGNSRDISAEYGSPLTLKVETNYKGSDITYQWYRNDGYDAYEDEEIFTKIEGATNSSYTIKNFTEPAEYRCTVTHDGQRQNAWFWTYFDLSRYSWNTTNPDAIASYKTHDGRDLTIDYHYDIEEREDISNSNFPEPGDTITMTEDASADVFTFDGEQFMNKDGEVLNFDFNSRTADANSGKLEMWAYSEEQIDHEKKTFTRKYDTGWNVEVAYTTDVKSIAFEPSKIKLYSEDVKRTNDNYTWYTFYNRYRYKDPTGYERNGAFLNGDKLTVTYNDGTKKVYIYSENQHEFISTDGGEWRYAFPEINEPELFEGNNTIKLYYQGRATSISVFMDTPALREWNGVLNKKMPVAKGVKVKAGKKSVTVKWTKASAKNLKKFDTVEIQVCPDKKFAKANTIRKTVKKTKTSLTIKKLKSKKYSYVRVRHVKGKGVKKKVSKWSKVYKVKVK